MITPLPSLDRTAATFRDDVDTFFATQLPAFSTEVESARVDINDNVVITARHVTQSAARTLEAQNAATSASTAAVSAGAVVWVSGLTYAAGDTRYSPITYMTYRRKTTGSGTTDPSLDTTNWAPLATGFVSQSGEETITNKRISAYHYLDRTVTNATASGTLALDCALGTVFDLTLAGNTTLQLTNEPTLTNETLNIVIRVSQGGTAYSLTWFAGITWITLGKLAPPAPGINGITEYIITSSAAGVYLGRKGAST